MENWNKTSFTELISDRTKDGIKLPTNEYNQSGLTAIIDQGQEFIAGYSDETEGAFTDVPAIIFGDHTRVFKYVDFPFFLGADGVKVLKANQEINYKYLYYYFLQAKFPNTGYARHFKWLKELQIPLPPLETQENIAAVLDKCTALIAKHKLMLEKYDTLIKSRFIEMFGDPVINEKDWDLKTLPELGEFGRGVSKHRPRNAPELLGGKYPLIQTGDVANANLYITNYESTYSEEGFKQSKMWKAGTLCITIAATIAKTAILTFDSCFPDSVVGFTPNEKTNSLFINYWFSFFQKILEEQAPAVAQKNINLQVLSELKIITPPISLQNDFAAFVQQIDKSKFAVQKSLEKTEILYKSLMQAYFG